MGRPARHDTDGLLNAAAELAADGGPRAVTMSAVARAVGAPSGSVYYRFADRNALLAALWLRTVREFHAGFLAALAKDPPLGAAVAAARHVVDWSRTHPAKARILLRGSGDFGERNWAARARAELRAANAEVARAVRALARRLPAPAERLSLALVDLPYAVVRRHLRSGGTVPRAAAELVADAAGTLLGAISGQEPGKDSVQ